MALITPAISSGGYLERYCSPDQLTIRSMQRVNAQIKVSGEKCVLLATNVFSDGFGDLMNCKHAYRIIKDAHPTWQVRVLIYLQHQSLPMSLREWGFVEEECLVVNPEGSSTETLLFYAKINKLNMDYPPNKERDAKLRLQLPAVAEKIDAFMGFVKNADLHIFVSTQLQPMPDTIDKSSSKFMYFAEYAGLSSSGRSFLMGVNPNSCGIYILNPQVPQQFSNLMLKKYYEEKESIYFSYGGNNLGDIQEYVSCLHHFNPEAKELNIISNVALEKIQGMVRAMHKDGIRKIVSVDREDREVTVSESDIPGQLVRFINPFPLCHGDMLRGMQKSAEPVGVTGNSTFSEILGLNQLPFYHMRHCTEPVWKQLIHLARNATPDCKELIAYLSHMHCVVVKNHPENHNEALKGFKISVLKEQWMQLVTILRRDWDVKDAYLGEIHRQIQEASL